MELSNLQQNQNIVLSAVINGTLCDSLSISSVLSTAECTNDQSLYIDQLTTSDAPFRVPETNLVTSLINDHHTRELYGATDALLLSVDEDDCRAKFNLEPGKHWSEVKSGIELVSTGKPRQVNITRVIKSEYDPYYYVATTQGLFRTVDSSLINCERFMKDELKAVWDDGFTDLSGSSYVENLIEIAPFTMLLFVHKLDGGWTNCFIVDTLEKVVLKREQLSYNNWYPGCALMSNDDITGIKVLCTRVLENQPPSILSINIENRSDVRIHEVANEFTGTNVRSSDRLCMMSNHVALIGRHNSESTGGQHHHGMYIADLDNNYALSVSQFHGVVSVQYRKTQDRMFVCMFDNDQLTAQQNEHSLYEITLTGDSIDSYQVKSYADDPILRDYANIRDIIYVEKTRQWAIVANRADVEGTHVFISNADESGNWTEFIDTGVDVGQDNYNPTFNVTDGVITINKITKEGGSYTLSFQNSTITNEATLAHLSDVAIRHVSINGREAKVSEDGLLELDIAQVVSDKIRTIVKSVDFNPSQTYTSDELQSKLISLLTALKNA